MIHIYNINFLILCVCLSVRLFERSDWHTGGRDAWPNGFLRQFAQTSRMQAETPPAVPQAETRIERAERAIFLYYLNLQIVITSLRSNTTERVIGDFEGTNVQ